MSKVMTYSQYMNMLSEKTIDNSKQLKRSLTQRRNGMEDLYGICFSGNGDATNPAKFYISLSPDFVYIQRLAFKVVIKPFTTTIKGATEGAVVGVDGTSLGISGSAITPNPHSHTTQSHTHNVINGMAFVQTTSTDWTVKVAGLDITPYLKEQQNIEPDAPLFSGAGIYPNSRLESDRDFYDILDVASVKMAEGLESEAEALVSPDFKEISFESDAPFGVDLYMYTKISTVNR